MSESTIAHYRVLHEVGRGGMGVVCKAEDIRLKRMVALKFLPAHLMEDKARRERLLLEARAASRLDHANICTIHEIEETADGQIVLVMAYYEGETLSQRIGRGRMELGAALEVASGILRGLQHAHQRGVIHRDIKPSNVILTGEGDVKIVDFGLAKQSGNNDCLTETGAMLGTVAYLPPEVLQGQETDHRGDLWSNGVVFYEMLAGAPPFAGANSYVLMHAILNDEITPIRQHRPELPAALHTVMLRALARARDARYQSAAEFLSDLERLEQGRLTAVTVVEDMPAANEKSVLVLPFTVVGNDARGEVFSDGLTDEIITDLSTISQLRVICRTSASRCEI